MDVVSPRWYTLSTTEIVSMNADEGYAKASAEAGKQVWPLFGNKFDPELTNFILSNPDKRNKVIEMIKNSLLRTKSQGINVDFENIDPKNKQDYVVFVQELKTALEPYDIVVSVDVSRENADPFWSGSLDREGLGEAADYIVMMGYDEHWASSPKAGSVASIPWTREGIELLMKEVPAHKIVLGVPFYTREWITNANGQVRSIDRTILETEKLIQEKGLKKKWDRKTSQNYVEFMENGEKHQIWVEDKDSMKLRYDLVEKYHLRGTAAWYVGGAPDDIWNILK
jgi:spore germination protein